MLQNLEVSKIISIFANEKGTIMAKKLTKKDRQELFAIANKFCIDIAKLVFAGVILAGILK